MAFFLPFRCFAWRYGRAKRRNNATQKDEITKRRQALALFCMASFVFSRSFFVILRGAFRLFAWSYFVFSIFGVAFLLFPLFAWRNFVLAPRHNARRKDEITKWHKISHHT